MTPIVLRVVGLPQPKGSSRVVPIRRQIRSLRDVRVTSDNPKLKAWERQVQQAAALAARGREPFDGPIRLDAVFTFLRPKSERRRVFHTVRPDLSKLVRGIEDALSGLIFVDDAQITATQSQKRYGETPGVVITIQPYEAHPLLAQEIRA